METETDWQNRPGVQMMSRLIGAIEANTQAHAQTFQVMQALRQDLLAHRQQMSAHFSELSENQDLQDALGEAVMSIHEVFHHVSSKVDRVEDIGDLLRVFGEFYEGFWE